MSPSRAIRMASAIASRRPATWIAPDVPPMTSARIRAGSSLRGLSSVTITTSESAVATLPISGLLPWSRSPPAPKTMISRPPPSLATCGLSAAIARPPNHLIRLRIIVPDHDVTARRQELVEQPHLALEISVHRLVIIEMVAAEIGECRGSERHAFRAMLIEAVARRFVGDMAD